MKNPLGPHPRLRGYEHEKTAAWGKRGYEKRSHPGEVAAANGVSCATPLLPASRRRRKRSAKTID